MLKAKPDIAFDARAKSRKRLGLVFFLSDLRHEAFGASEATAGRGPPCTVLHTRVV